MFGRQLSSDLKVAAMATGVELLLRKCRRCCYFLKLELSRSVGDTTIDVRGKTAIVSLDSTTFELDHLLLLLSEVFSVGQPCPGRNLCFASNRTSFECEKDPRTQHNETCSSGMEKQIVKWLNGRRFSSVLMACWSRCRGHAHDYSGNLRADGCWSFCNGKNRRCCRCADVDVTPLRCVNITCCEACCCRRCKRKKRTSVSGRCFGG